MQSMQYFNIVMWKIVLLRIVYCLSGSLLRLLDFIVYILLQKTDRSIMSKNCRKSKKSFECKYRVHARNMF